MIGRREGSRMNHQLVCQSCDRRHSPGGYPVGCPDCRDDDRAGRLEVEYDIESVAVEDVVDGSRSVRSPETMWDYRELLPLLSEAPVTLHEGGTPLLQTSVESPCEILLKNETVNPTWSYKDRLNALLLSNATALGEDRIATSSTGNHGASTAAYASLAGIDDVIVLVPPETEPPLHRQIRAYGGDVAIVERGNRSKLLRGLVERGWYPTVNITDPYVGLPYSYEAYKTIAFEVIDQLPEPPAAVVSAIGTGDGLYGTWKGFRELAEFGIIETPPRMIGVQPAERTAVVDALEDDAESVGESPGPRPITTSAGGTSAGDHVLRAIRESAGTAVPVEREDIEAAIRDVGRDGIFLEPASAITVAGVDVAVDRGHLDRGETVVCLGTGAGVKWPQHTKGAVGEATTIEPTMEAIDSFLD